jgi:hypothetical protein
MALHKFDKKNLVCISDIDPKGLKFGPGEIAHQSIKEDWFDGFSIFTGTVNVAEFEIKRFESDCGTKSCA